MAISQLTPLGASACPLSPARQGTESARCLAAGSRSRELRGQGPRSWAKGGRRGEALGKHLLAAPFYTRVSSRQ